MSDAPPGALADLTLVQGEAVSFVGHEGATIGGYLARPSAQEHPYPGVILIHAAPGITDHSRDVARRLAALGHVALVPDLYSRTHAPSPADMDAMMAVLYAKRDDVVIGDLLAALDYLHARADVSAKIGAIGFCMGGRYALLLACTTDRLVAVVDCWGGFITRADPDNVSTPQRPVPPLERVGALRVPLLAAIGLEDHNPSPADGELLRARLAQTSQPTRVDFYADAGHAFFDDTRDGYRALAAAQLWRNVVEFFEQYLR